MARVVIDPITRIEGHLRVEIEVKDGKVVDAYSSGTMVRGFERILKGRDPRDAWAFTERACGVCTTVHALASVRAVEDALGIAVPPNAELVRNLMFCAQYLQDHVVHFYHLHALDWVDVVSALKADPSATSALAQKVSPHWGKSSAGYFTDIQKRLATFVESGQLGIFAKGYWGHAAYKLPPEANLMAVAHYLEALDWQKEVVKIHTIFGGKNPHPNYLVGGVPCSVNLDDSNAINAERLAYVGKLLDDAQQIVEQLYLPDLMAVASFYKDWGAIGGGLPNYLAYGDLPVNGFADTAHFKFPRGAILNRNLAEVLPVDAKDPQGIQEYVTHSWYQYANGDAPLHPFEGETTFNYTGPKPPYEHLNVDEKYSWLKTPRWKDHPMEVGPLSRMLVAYASGRTEVKDVVDDTLKRLGVPVGALFSTLGRTAARGLETKLIAGWAKEFYGQFLANIKNGDTRMFDRSRWSPDQWPAETKGVGLSEAPRGALAHWIVIKDGKIENYQLVVPSTWNASPRDAKGQMSAYESALIGTPIANPDQPIEVLRTIHSFDPCIACAVHLHDERGTWLHQVQVF